MLFYRCLLFCSSISASRLAGIIGALFIPVPIGTILCGGGFLVPLHGPASPHRVQNQAASQRPCLVKFGSHSTAATSSSPPTSSRPSSRPTRKPPTRKSKRLGTQAASLRHGAWAASPQANPSQAGSPERDFRLPINKKMTERTRTITDRLSPHPFWTSTESSSTPTSIRRS